MPRNGDVPMELVIVQGGPYCAPDYHSFPTEQRDKTFIMLILSARAGLAFTMLSPPHAIVRSNAWDP